MSVPVLSKTTVSIPDRRSSGSPPLIRTPAAAPRPLPRTGLTDTVVTNPLLARVELDTGRSFDIRFDTSVAPLAYGRIKRLVGEKYYDGLTFHRVIEGFMAQGGTARFSEARVRW